jgi:hypothetical protein
VITKSPDNILSQPLNIEGLITKDNNANEGFVCDFEMLDANDISVLRSILELSPEEPATGEHISTTASVKFMITMQDENELHNLGYSHKQIDKLKPQEAADILQARTMAELTIGLE